MKLALKMVLIFICIVLAAFSGYKINKIKKVEAKKTRIPIIVGFAQLGSESAWRNANTASVKNAAKDYGISLIFKNADGSQQMQKQYVQDFIYQGVDVIILPPIVAKGWEKTLTDAKKAGIPVIIADRSIEPNNPDLYSVFVGEDFFYEGEKAAKWLVDNVGSNKKINILELRGLAGSAPTIDRAKGFRKIIAKYPNINFIDSVSGDFIKANGKLQMQKMLKKYGQEINVVFAHNDDMALGAIEAIQEYGLKPGKDILIISVDGGRKALEAIKAGKANVSVECTPILGSKLMETAIRLYNKEKVPKKIVMEEKVFTISNVDKELPLRPY